MFWGFPPLEASSPQRGVIKPNLINTEKPPTTTPYEIVDALTKYYHETGCEVIVAEDQGGVRLLRCTGSLAT